MATEEELRAEAYQASAARRCAFQRELAAKLHGSESAAHALDVAWDPYYQWTLERGIRVPLDEDC